jgi:hypothetical protein
MGIGHIPVVNVENACASGSSAFVLACNHIRSGAGDVALDWLEKCMRPTKTRCSACSTAHGMSPCSKIRDPHEAGPRRGCVRAVHLPSRTACSWMSMRPHGRICVGTT